MGGTWPRKRNVLGVGVSVTTYQELLECVFEGVRARTPACVSHLAVHGLVTASRDRELWAFLDEFEAVAPDGMPVKLALDALYKTKLPDRVYGPEFTLRVCERAASDGTGVYLYGSHRNVVEALREKMMERYPGLQVVGCEPSEFRALTKAEDQDLVMRIDRSGAGIVLLGLGCPLQERFAHEHKDRIRAVQVCVGAAFDFLSGNKRMAPAWMQRHSLEWLFRMLQEPKRLWRRYAVTNAIFLSKVILQYAGLREYSGPHGGAQRDAKCRRF
jgi:N-acetylglucosaminyldiphosphoundecaprenol N-acetyl-beta-D-mannosaminyltransferase